jgi:hypothetical protein
VKHCFSDQFGGKWESRLIGSPCAVEVPLERTWPSEQDPLWKRLDLKIRRYLDEVLHPLGQVEFSSAKPDPGVAVAVGASRVRYAVILERGSLGPFPTALSVVREGVEFRSTPLHREDRFALQRLRKRGDRIIALKSRDQILDVYTGLVEPACEQVNVIQRNVH